jgi:hypothetical protein
MCRCLLVLALLRQGRLGTAVKIKDFQCFGRGNPDAPQERHPCRARRNDCDWEGASR